MKNLTAALAAAAIAGGLAAGAAPAAPAPTATELAAKARPKPALGRPCPRVGAVGRTARGVKVRCARRTGRRVWVRYTRPPIITVTPADPAPAPTQPPGWTRDTPVALGQVGEVDGWSVRVNGWTPDGTSLVAASTVSFLYDPPTAGRVFTLVNLTATRTGDQQASLSAARFSVLGPSNVAYNGLLDCKLNTIPAPLPSQDVFKGGQITGNICIEVPAPDAASGLELFYTDFGGGTPKMWFALR